MSVWSLTYQQSVFKRCHSDKRFSEFYLQDGGGKNHCHPMYRGVGKWISQLKIGISGPWCNQISHFRVLPDLPQSWQDAIYRYRRRSVSLCLYAKRLSYWRSCLGSRLGWAHSEPYIWCGAHWHHLANAIEWPLSATMRLYVKLFWPLKCENLPVSVRVCVVVCSIFR